MNPISCNCCICAVEFSEGELQSVALSKINTTRFKICQSCLDKSDPADDYKQAREIVNSYLTFSARISFENAQEILNSRKS